MRSASDLQEAPDHRIQSSRPLWRLTAEQWNLREKNLKPTFRQKSLHDRASFTIRSYSEGRGRRSQNHKLFFIIILFYYFYYCCCIYYFMNPVCWDWMFLNGQSWSFAGKRERERILGHGLSEVKYCIHLFTHSFTPGGCCTHASAWVALCWKRNHECPLRTGVR